MLKSLCYCHWSRQVSNMRHCWNKIFFVIIRVMVVINQIIIMAPFIYYKNSEESKMIELKYFAITSLITNSKANQMNKKQLQIKWKFRTHGFVTLMTISLSIFYILASPFMVKLASNIYYKTRDKQDDFFVIIAKFIMGCDVLCGLLIMINNIWQRDNIVKILNKFNKLLLEFQQLQEHLVDFKIILALLLKMALSVYEMVLSIPFIISISSRLNTQTLVAFIFTHFLQGLSYLFALNMFIFILILLLCSLHLEKELKCNVILYNDLKMSKLIKLQNLLKDLMDLFTKTFQFAITSIILLYFITILSNIYAMLDYYVSNHRIFGEFVTYVLSIVMELYSLILISYLCERSQRRVKDLFLQREELHFFKVFYI